MRGCGWSGRAAATGTQDWHARPCRRRLHISQASPVRMWRPAPARCMSRCWAASVFVSGVARFLARGGLRKSKTLVKVLALAAATGLTVMCWPGCRGLGWMLPLRRTICTRLCVRRGGRWHRIIGRRSRALPARRPRPRKLRSGPGPWLGRGRTGAEPRATRPKAAAWECSRAQRARTVG